MIIRDNIQNIVTPVLGGIIPSSGFSPLDLDGLKLWLDASDIDTVIESGGFVSSLNDKSGEGNDVTQAVGAKQPLTNVNTIKGLNVITFDGIDDNLRRVTFTGGSLSQPNTIFLVWEVLTFTNFAEIIIDGGGAERHIIRIEGIPNEWQMFAGLFATGSIRALNTPYATSSLFNTASSLGYINGVLDITGNVSTGSFNGISIAARFSGTSNFININIGEIIVYNRLVTNDERLTVESYLSDRWIV